MDKKKVGIAVGCAAVAAVIAICAVTFDGKKDDTAEPAATVETAATAEPAATPEVTATPAPTEAPTATPEPTAAIPATVATFVSNQRPISMVEQIMPPKPYPSPVNTEATHRPA